MRIEVLRRDGFRCVKCGARGKLEVDHILPVRTHPHLSYALENLQTLCGRCHASKTRLECGFDPPDPKRVEWRNAVLALCKAPRIGLALEGKNSSKDQDDA